MIASSAARCYLALAAIVPSGRDNDPFVGSMAVVRYEFDDTDELDLLPGLWQPRDWTRRKGPEFPAYVKTGIDRERGYQSRYSLRFDLNGAPAINYSPPLRIDGYHTYVFEGYVRTQLLVHDAALFSVSFLNEKRQRVQRFLTRPVSGTHQDWVRVRIGPMLPREDVQFAVIGCHVVQGQEMDIGGAVWFDRLYLGRVPQLTLESNYYSHFRQRQAPIEIKSSVSGLDLNKLFTVALADPNADLNELENGQIPASVRQSFATNGRKLGAGIRLRSDGSRQWRLTADTARYLLVHETEGTLTVYDPDTSYELQLRILDGAGRLVDGMSFPLVAYEPNPNLSGVPGSVTRQWKTWRRGRLEYGYYQVEAALTRDGDAILQQQTSFAVMDLVDRVRPGGEFGWSLSQEATGMSARDVADVATQAGINWLKYPVWRAAFAEDPSRVQHVAEIFSRLVNRGMTPVGVLSDPPAEIREKFAENWTGVAEIFALPRDSWSPWLEPVIGRYSSGVRHWQLGGESDLGFVGMKQLPETVSTVKREFDRIGRNTRIGLRWDWQMPLARQEDMPHSFLSISAWVQNHAVAKNDNPAAAERPLSGSELMQRLRQTAESEIPRWVLIRPPSRDNPAEERKAAMVKQMVAAKAGGAEAIFAVDVLDEDRGLLNPNGAPKMLLLPWRTAALALQGSQFLGSLQLPGGSENYVFSRNGEAILFVWNEEPVTEQIYLGDRDNVLIADLSGRQVPAPVDPETGQQLIDVTPLPRIIRGCSEPVARWRLATRFEQPQLPATTGRHSNAILGRNTFPQGTNGHATMRMPREWKTEPERWEFPVGAGQPFRLPMVLTVPITTATDNAMVAIDFELDVDRQYNFRVYRPIGIGSGDIFVQAVDRKLPDGRLVVEQTIVNRTDPEEVVNFACSLFVPGSRRQKKLVIKLGHGRDQKKYFLPDADVLKGQELWLRAEEINGRRVLNYRWRVGDSWNQQDENAAQSSPLPTKG